MIVRGAGNTDAASTGDCLQSCSNIDAIAKEVTGLDHDITDMDADTEVEVTVWRQACVGLGERRPSLDRALHGINATAELRQHAVPGLICHPATTGSNQAVKEPP